MSRLFMFFIHTRIYLKGRTFFPKITFANFPLTFLLGINFREKKGENRESFCSRNFLPLNELNSWNDRILCGWNQRAEYIQTFNEWIDYFDKKMWPFLYEVKLLMDCGIKKSYLLFSYFPLCFNTFRLRKHLNEYTFL